MHYKMNNQWTECQLAIYSKIIFSAFLTDNKGH